MADWSIAVLIIKQPSYNARHWLHFISYVNTASPHTVTRRVWLPSNKLFWEKRPSFICFLLQYMVWLFIIAVNISLCLIYKCNWKPGTSPRSSTWVEETQHLSLHFQPPGAGTGNWAGSTQSLAGTQTRHCATACGRPAVPHCPIQQQLLGSGVLHQNFSVWLKLKY